MSEPQGLPMWVIYDHPTDFPDHFVARRWDGLTPTDDTIKSDQLGTIRFAMRTLGLVCLARQEGDDAKIIEVWL